MRTRNYKFRTGSRAVDIQRALSTQQLAWIGAVAMAYNECEEWLKALFVNVLGPPWAGNNLVTSVGIGQIATVSNIAIRNLGLPDPTVKMAEFSLIGDGFTQLKSYRDGVIHARLLDQASAIGSVPNKGNPDYVLLSEAAVSGLYERLVLLRDELQELTTIVAFTSNVQAYADDSVPSRERLLKSIQAATLQLRQLQQQRRRLKPLPTFPREDQSFAIAPHKKADSRRSARQDKK